MEKDADKAKDFLVDGKFCPKCGEVITPADVETFYRCPYCDNAFDNDERMENFILKPMLKNWVIKNCQRFVR